MAKYGVVRTDNMTGTDVRSELVSVNTWVQLKLLLPKLKTEVS